MRLVLEKGYPVPAETPTGQVTVKINKNKPVIKKFKKVNSMNKSKLVYSTEFGRICPECSKPVSACVCKKNKSNEMKGTLRHYPDDGIIRIMRETKGHGGKTVTKLSNISIDNNLLKELVKQLKNRCGTGGTIKDDEIIIQGDHRQAILDELIGQGYRAKIAGG
jgi:translation initiation factor 1